MVGLDNDLLQYSSVDAEWKYLSFAEAAFDHGDLTGLGDDDHTQYLLADGTRILAGAWDMGSQNLTNVNIDSGTVDSITFYGDQSKPNNGIKGLIVLHSNLFIVCYHPPSFLI